MRENSTLPSTEVEPAIDHYGAPLRNFIANILLRALRDLKDKTLCRYERAQAAYWILADDVDPDPNDCRFTFRQICETLGHDPEMIIEGVKKGTIDVRKYSHINRPITRRTLVKCRTSRQKR